MSSEPRATGEGLRPGGGNDDPDEPTVLLFMASGRDRELLVETVGDRYRVDTATEPDALETEFDCCVLDRERFARSADAIRARRESAEVALPFVLLADDPGRATNPNVWEYVDDVVELPVPREELLSRIGTLVQRRRAGLELARKTRQLEATIENLQLKERAIDEAPLGLTITDPSREDNPITYVNDRFETLTGYEGSEVIGRNHRFLQGEGTDPADRAALRAAVDERRTESVEILNYRKNGRKFWNEVTISPVHDENGALTNFVGFQREITDRKIRERRLEVLNRVLSHNLRNKMNIIEGYAALLREEFGDGPPPDPLEQIDDAATNLGGLADTVQEIDRTLSGAGAGSAAIALDERIEESISAFEDRFPDATFSLVVRDEGPHQVAVTGLMSAVEEAIENAVKHNPDPSPSVEIRLRRRSGDWIDVEIEDDGPGVPDRELAVLEDGETSLNHADRLGLWLIYWVVSRAGGDLSVADAEPTGTVLTLSIPAHG